MKKHYNSLALLTAILIFVGCVNQNAKAPGIVIEDVWSRPASGTGVAYLQIRNNGSEPDRLVAAYSQVAGNVELHETSEVDGKMTMMMLKEGVVMAPGEIVNFEPGGKHIMLIGLKQALQVGEQFDIEFEFEKAGRIAAVSRVERR